MKDPQDLPLLLKVNGATKQSARSSGMIFSIAEQIAKQMAPNFNTEAMSSFTQQTGPSGVPNPAGVDMDKVCRGSFVLCILCMLIPTCPPLSFHHML
ncbi:MAG: hypothetical protein HC767_14790 [Akkermansiaceae bacterium]|nr:hypothetical protein [Akkermansiaceae bacterium]